MMPEMVAGRELDALVAEKVMGMVVMACRDIDGEWWSDPNEMFTGKEVCVPPRWGHARELPLHSTSIRYAWEVWEKLIADGWYPDLTTTYSAKANGLVYGCELQRGGDGTKDHYWVQATTAPLAICLAALAAVGIPPTEGDETK